MPFSTSTPVATLTLDRDESINVHSEEITMNSIERFLKIKGVEKFQKKISSDGSITIDINVTFESLQLTHEIGVLFTCIPIVAKFDPTDEEIIDRVSIGLSQINHRLLCGSFAIDLLKGEISYRNPHSLQDGLITPEQFIHLLAIAKNTVLEQRPAIEALMTRPFTHSAIEVVEKRWNELVESIAPSSSAKGNEDGVFHSSPLLSPMPMSSSVQESEKVTNMHESSLFPPLAALLHVASPTSSSSYSSPQILCPDEHPSSPGARSHSRPLPQQRSSFPSRPSQPWRPSAAANASANANDCGASPLMPTVSGVVGLMSPLLPTSDFAFTITSPACPSSHRSPSCNPPLSFFHNDWHPAHLNSHNMNNTVNNHNNANEPQTRNSPTHTSHHNTLVEEENEEEDDSSEEQEEIDTYSTYNEDLSRRDHLHHRRHRIASFMAFTTLAPSIITHNEDDASPVHPQRSPTRYSPSPPHPSHSNRRLSTSLNRPNLGPQASAAIIAPAADQLSSLRFGQQSPLPPTPSSQPNRRVCFADADQDESREMTNGRRLVPREASLAVSPLSPVVVTEFFHSSGVLSSQQAFFPPSRFSQTPTSASAAMVKKDEEIETGNKSSMPNIITGVFSVEDSRKREMKALSEIWQVAEEELGLKKDEFENILSMLLVK